MIGRFCCATAAAWLLASCGAPANQQATQTKQPASIVLVHGMGMDAASWRPVADLLTAKGYRVEAVQEPLTGFAGDVKATRLAIDAQPGPVVLVGHSYGGVVITTAGNDPKVKALVYVAALQPDKGETMGSLNARMPSAFPKDGTVANPPGFVKATDQAWIANAAQDLPAKEAAGFAARQRPTSTDVFTAPTTDPAWRHKPTFGIVATKDRTVNPELERWMYKRSGTATTEVDTSHMAYLSNPQAVVAVIERAARSVG